MRRFMLIAAGLLVASAPGTAQTSYNQPSTRMSQERMSDDRMSQDRMSRDRTAGQARSYRSSMPMRPGNEARPASWNHDGVPKPPRMWRGQGENRWPNHYRACKRRYSSYNYRNDTYRRGGRQVRCAL